MTAYHADVNSQTALRTENAANEVTDETAVGSGSRDLWRTSCDECS
jgi:hypothetical protein